MQRANVLSCHRLLVIYISGLYRLLNPPASVTNCLQVRGVDIIEAYEDISSVIKDIISTRKNIEKKKKQVNRDNTQADSPKTCYRQVFAIPFIDKLISELELRFTKPSHSASRFLFSIPTVITKVPLDKDA